MRCDASLDASWAATANLRGPFAGWGPRYDVARSKNLTDGLPAYCSGLQPLDRKELPVEGPSLLRRVGSMFALALPAEK